MNMALARARYQQVSTAGVTAPDDPHQVISVTLRELGRSLDVLQAACPNGARLSTAQGDHLTRCFTAIYVLQSSLDFEAGGDLAPSLFQVYEFVRLELLKLWRKETGSDLAACAQVIAEIRTSWDEMPLEHRAKSSTAP